MRKNLFVLLNAIIMSFLIHSNCAFCAPKDVKNLMVIDGKAYVINAYQSFEILNISNPDNITTMGSIALDNPRDVKVIGNYAYVTDGGLCIINISDPSNPYIEGRLTDTIGSTYGVDVVGNYAYTADAAPIKSGKIAGLTVYDISNKSLPIIIGHINTDNATGVKVVGSYAYVADEWGGLKIIDITNPQVLVPVSSRVTNCAVKVDIVGNYAYVADDTEGLKIFDITNPSDPILIGSSAAGNARAVKVAGNYAYVADYTTGLKIIDISDPENPLLISETISTLAQGISLSNDYVYMANGLAGIDVIKIDITRVEKSSNQNKAVIFYSGDFNKMLDGALTKIKITTLPKHGTLSLSGNVVGVNQEIIVADLENLIFTPERDWYGKANFLLSITNTDTYADNQAIISMTVTPTVLESIAITPTTSSIPDGLTKQFTATGAYSDSLIHSIINFVIWDSSNMSVATINSLGLATALDPGITNITASLSGIVSLPQELTVTVASLQSIEIIPSRLSIASGLTQQFNAIGTYTDNSMQDITAAVTWVSSDPSKATINNITKSGWVTALAVGETSITASLSGITSPSQTLTVTDAVLQSISITPIDSNLNIAKGSTKQFMAIGTYSNSSTQDITNLVAWNSDALNIATISATGLVNTLATGIVNITASLLEITSPPQTLTSVNAPIVNDIAKLVALDKVIIFNKTDFTANDSNLTKIKITSLPTYGLLKFAKNNITADQLPLELSSEDLGNLTFIPSMIGDDVFIWQGFDGIIYSTNSADVSIIIAKTKPKWMGAAIGSAIGITATVAGTTGYWYKKCHNKQHRATGPVGLRNNMVVDL